jgi:hypothetical protein
MRAQVVARPLPRCITCEPRPTPVERKERGQKEEEEEAGGSTKEKMPVPSFLAAAFVIGGNTPRIQARGFEFS